MKYETITKEQIEAIVKNKNIEDVFVTDTQAKIDVELENEIDNIKNKIYDLTRAKRALEIDNKRLFKNYNNIKREKRALELECKELRHMCHRYYQIIQNCR